MELDAVKRFRADRARFIYQMNEITRRARAGEFSREEAVEAQKLAQEAQPLASKLDYIEGLLKSFENTTGMSLSGLGGLGLLPAVPIVIATAIVGVTYLLGKMLDKTTDFLSRSGYVKQRAAQGVSAATALQEWEKSHPEGGGLFGDLSKLAWPLAIVAGLLLFVKR